ESVHCHQRSNERSIDPARIREKYRPNSIFEIEDGGRGQLRAMCVPIGREAGSGLVALSRRPDFPTDTEQTLLRVAANQASTAIQRAKSEAKVAEQTRVLQQLKETETALYT